MGNTSSRSSEINVFQKELDLINDMINNIINDKDIFYNNDYNFLSKDVCNRYQLILEEELSKHLKVSIKSLGTSLYLIPKDNDDAKLTNYKLTKQQICEKVSNHYIKILYIFSLIKYVYNLEKHGDLSIGGIIMRNIRVLDDIMEINFCDMPHRNYRLKGLATYKLDFSKLEGFQFFVDYFLDKTEASAFVGLLRNILGRSSKNQITNKICEYFDKNKFTKEDLTMLENLYKSRFNEKLVCKKNSNTETKSSSSSMLSNHSLNLNIFIDKDNPILDKVACFAPRKLIIKTSSTEGKKVLELYNKMKKNYETNFDQVYEILDKLIIKTKEKTKYELRDIDKITLDTLVNDIKIIIKTFYLQSFVDYQNIIDCAKHVPNIEFTSE